jgi:hypothetical protein
MIGGVLAVLVIYVLVNSPAGCMLLLTWRDRACGGGRGARDLGDRGRQLITRCC